MNIENPYELRNIPVRSLQTFLRQISQTNPNISTVIPDGTYGPDTQKTVTDFQREYGIEQTGNVNFDTWNRILEEYDNSLYLTEEAEYIKIFPAPDFAVNPGEESPHLYIIQCIISSLSNKLPQIGNITVNGMQDEESTQATKNLQKIFRQEETGTIDKKFWNMLAALYKVYVSENNVENYAAF